MKKGIILISLVLLFASMIIFMVLGFNPEKIIENIELITCITSIIIPLVLISRGSLLLQRETYQILGQVAIYFGGFCIIIFAIQSFNLIDIPEKAILICNLFLFYLLLLTYIFEINSCNKKVTIYQFLIASIVTILVLILGYNSIVENISFNINDYSKLTVVIIASLLSIFSIPLANYIFDKSDTGITNIDVLVDNYHNDVNKILNTTNINSTKQNVEQHTEQNNIVKEMPTYDIPIIKEPVSVNNNSNNQNNSNL